MNERRRAQQRAAWLFVALAASACGDPAPPAPRVDLCAGSPLSVQKMCRCDAECDDGEIRAFCDVASGECMPTDVICTVQSHCCPGQICAQGVLCYDKAPACNADETCPVAGQRCQTYGIENPQSGCLFDRCPSSGTCGDGLTCWNGHCVGAVPCGGGCGATGVCVTQTNSCFDVMGSVAFPATCRLTCPAGTMRAFSATTPIFNRCTMAAVGCVCLTPPLVP